MNMVPVRASRSVKSVEPFNVISQLIGRKFSGCLRLMSGEGFWSIYFDQGELVYGTTSTGAFQRLEYYLNQIGQQPGDVGLDHPENVPKIMSATRVHERLTYEKMKPAEALPSPDYQAICWLVDQKYLTYSQASVLIEAITTDSIASMLSLKQGSCKVLKPNQQSSIRKVCRLNTRLIVDSCRKQAHWKRHERAVEKIIPKESPKATPPYQRNISLGTFNPSLNSQSRTHLSPTQPGRISNGRSNKGKNKYIIGCIDDSPAVLNSLRSYLDNKQFSVFTVSNPVKALMTIIRHKPNLILLDVMMPKLDGYELCSLLRKHPEFKGIPIIIVTSNTGLVDRAKAKVVRASGYLAKPFTKEDLIKVISKHLEIAEIV